VPTKAAVRSLSEAPSDFCVEVVALRCLHGDVAGGRVEQREVPLGVVADLPVELANDDVFEQAALFDLGPVLEQAAGPRRVRALGYPLADPLVDIPDLNEEWVTAVGDYVGGAPEGEVASGGATTPRPARSASPCRSSARPSRRRQDRTDRGPRGARSRAPSVISTPGKSVRLRRAATPRSGPISMHVIRNPRRARGIVAFPVAHPTSKSRSPVLIPAASTSAS